MKDKRWDLVVLSVLALVVAVGLGWWSAAAVFGQVGVNALPIAALSGFLSGFSFALSALALLRWVSERARYANVSY